MHHCWAIGHGAVEVAAALFLNVMGLARDADGTVLGRDGVVLKNQQGHLVLKLTLSCIEKNPNPAEAAHLAVATRAGKPKAPMGEELMVHGWHVRVITANILEQQPEFFVGFSVVYTFASPSHHAVARCVAEAAFVNKAVLVTTTQHLVTAGLPLRTYWPEEDYPHINRVDSYWHRIDVRSELHNLIMALAMPNIDEALDFPFRDVAPLAKLAQQLFGYSGAPVTENLQYTLDAFFDITSISQNVTPINLLVLAPGAMATQVLDEGEMAVSEASEISIDGGV